MAALVSATATLPAVGCDVVAGLVEQPDDREVDPLGVGVLDVADRAGAVRRGDVVGDAVGADLRLGAAERRVEGHARAAAAEVQLALDERAVDRRRLAGHVLRELRRGAGAVGAHHRDDRDVRQRLAVVGGDRRVAPARDGAGEDLRQRGRREPQVADPLAADGQVVHERRAAGHDRQVGELRATASRPAGRAPAGSGTGSRCSAKSTVAWMNCERPSVEPVPAKLTTTPLARTSARQASTATWLQVEPAPVIGA